jgi:hypothetical protein
VLQPAFQVGRTTSLCVSFGGVMAVIDRCWEGDAQGW